MNTITISPVEVEAMAEILNLAYWDQQSYLSIGNPHIDYGQEWPEAARYKTEMFRTIAAFAARLGLHGEKERWSTLADNFDASGKEYSRDQELKISNS